MNRVPAPAAPETVRAFVAIEPGEAARAALADLQARLAAAAPPRAVRWTRPEQCHLTLCFLGQVPRERLPALEQRLAEAAAASAGFALELGVAGAFPALEAPRVLWVGLRGDLGALAALAGRVAGAAADFGDHREEREFHPHLTLGRVADRDRRVARALAEPLARAPRPPASRWAVTGFKLFRSELRPEGAVYSVLADFPLRAAA
jgi:2'-5' RNA ligase